MIKNYPKRELFVEFTDNNDSSYNSPVLNKPDVCVKLDLKGLCIPSQINGIFFSKHSWMVLLMFLITLELQC